MATVSAREKVIQASIELMTGRGFTATTVDEIVNQAGVAKGSVYHAFKSKEELAIAALEHYLQRGLGIVMAGDFQDTKDPVEKALDFLDYLEERSTELWSHGCLLGTLAIEVADNYPALLKEIDTLFKRFELGLESVFEPALKARKIKDVTASDLSLHLLAVVEGSIITARSHTRPELLKEGISHFRHYLTLILA